MAEDPELERRLEAMFASTRPRPGFGGELWQRIEARRPWYRRLGLRFQPALRYAPALATLLVVALGVTWLATSFRGGAGSGVATSSAGAPGLAKETTAAPAFGVLPSIGQVGASSSTLPQATVPGADANAGRGFSGSLPELPATLPVFRYEEPSAEQRAAAAVILRARTGLAATVTPSDPAQGVEPQFAVSGARAETAVACLTTRCAPAAEAAAFLAGHGMTPAFPHQVEVAVNGSQVVYDRQFDVPSGPVRQVRRDGGAAGLTVDISGTTIAARGPLDLPLASASYPLRTSSAALAAAGVQQGSESAGPTHAELVYVLVVSGGHGYFEPALLLAGPGGARLAPLIAAAWLAG